MKYGFVVPNNFGVEDAHAVAAIGVQVEELGFDTVWVNHHVLNVGYVKERVGNKPYQDALITLTWIAAHTSRVRLGTSVLVLPYLHPMIVAKEAATLDHLSNGRLQLGVGVGSLPEENAALGVPYDTRGKYMNEFLEVMIKLWTEDGANFGGEFFSFTDITSSPKPVQQPHVPLYMGGNRPPSLRRVAAYGTGWHPMLVSPDGIRKRFPTIEEEAERLGRPVPREIQVRLDMSAVTPETVAEYEKAGATELVMSLNTGDTGKIEKEIARFAQEMI